MDLKRLIPLILATLVFPCLAVAKTVYIGDTLYVPMRSGPGSEYRIVNRALKTGTVLTLKEQKPRDGYYKVQTSDGKTGFVPSQYLLFEPPAVLKLTSLQEKNSQLQTQVKELTTKLRETEKNLKQKSSALTGNTQTVSALQSELTRIKTISAKSLELDKRNQELVLTNEQLLNELQTLQSTNQQLTDTSNQRWYIYGAGTLFFGLLIGLIAPMFQPRRKKSGWA